MIQMEFEMHRGGAGAITPSLPSLGFVLSGLNRDGVRTALEHVAKIRSGELPEAEDGMNDYCYRITPQEAEFWFELLPDVEGKISLDDWEDCLRRFDAWMTTQGFREP